MTFHTSELAVQFDTRSNGCYSVDAGQVESAPGLHRFLAPFDRWYSRASCPRTSAVHFKSSVALNV